MLTIGCHLSVSKGYLAMGKTARAIGTNTFQFFTRNPRGSHKDRHEKIGHGSLGLETFARVINHPALRNLPFYLETPNEIDGYAEEIRLLKTLYRE